MVVSLLNDRPNSDNFEQSEVLHEFTKATNVRLRLLRPKTTLGHLISVQRQDPTVTRRYFYSIKDINIGGRCVCNGHANSCDISDANEPQKLYCKCQHNTCGAQCEQCCPGYVQFKWKPATVTNPNICQPCNCLGHSQECYYDEEVDNQKTSMDQYGIYSGGGVCTNCQHNTEGTNCDKCRSGFYRPYNRPLNETNVCEKCQCDANFYTGSCAEGSGKCRCRENFQEPNCAECSYGFTGYPECKPCDCYLNGTYGAVCELRTGQCPCLPAYTGQYCRACAEGYFGFPSCSACECTGVGAVSDLCDISTGQCQCKQGYGGRQCRECDVGFYNYPQCSPCNCDKTGTTEEICNKNSGQCICKEGYGGARCDQCISGYFGFPNCTDCGCDTTGSSSRACNSNGKCRCLSNFGGLKCADCSVGHYKYPDCMSCNCDQSGSHGLSCNDEGQCICKRNFDGPKCNKCREGFYNWPICEECNCDPAGVVVAFAGCGSVAAGELCKCKERVAGRICNTCKELYWNLQKLNPLGCQDCLCNRPGTVSSVGNCESESGQCICRENVEGKKCETCKLGSYGLQEGNLFGCSNCECDVGGALHPACERFDALKLGQCQCRHRIHGRKCDAPISTHYYPTLCQHQYEIEDGRTVSESPARFGYDESKFPNYSWKGYAVFSDLMKEVIMEINIQRPTFYRTVFRYLNEGPDQVAATLTFTPEFQDDIQNIHFHFSPTGKATPKIDFAINNYRQQVQTLVLSKGKYKATLKVDKPVEIDYMVLLPEAFYEATLLQESSSPPCRDYERELGSLCRHYSYPKFSDKSMMVRGEAGYASDKRRIETKKYEDVQLNQKLNVVSSHTIVLRYFNALLLRLEPWPRSTESSHN